VSMPVSYARSLTTRIRGDLMATAPPDRHAASRSYSSRTCSHPTLRPPIGYMSVTSQLCHQTCIIGSASPLSRWFNAAYKRSDAWRTSSSLDMYYAPLQNVKNVFSPLGETAKSLSVARKTPDLCDCSHEFRHLPMKDASERQTRSC